jgi:murein DD-endopeptidase MepM/ murein hydrolase activator NlpD
MTQAYGATKFAQKAYKTKFHNGVDFAVPIGTPVLAAEDGVVLMAGNNGRVQYGKYIVIKHSNGLATLYGHLSRHAVATGSAVKRGDIIGYSGNTGYSTGAHLHFTVYLSSTVQLKAIGGAGVVPVGYTLNPSDYL